MPVASWQLLKIETAPQQNGFLFLSVEKHKGKLDFQMILGDFCP